MSPPGVGLCADAVLCGDGVLCVDGVLCSDAVLNLPARISTLTWNNTHENTHGISPCFFLRSCTLQQSQPWRHMP
jgi:hypothetical protein